MPRAESQQLSESPAFAAQNRRLSAVYATQASSAIRAGEWATAQALIEVSLQFEPSNSDALYERGVVLDQHPSGIEGAITAFEAAVAAGKWENENPDVCRLRLAGLLYRTKRYAAAIAQLSAMSDRESAQWLYLAERSEAAEGRTARAFSLLEGAIRAYPKDYRFVVDRVRFDRTYRELLARRFLTRSDIANFPASVLREVIVDTPNGELQDRLIAAYRAIYGSSLTVLAESLMDAKKAQVPLIDAFVTEGGLERGGIAEALYHGLRSPSAKEYLVAKAAAFGGASDWDTNRDGYVEQRVQYQAGRIVQLVIDERQDGVPEYLVQFRDSIPYEATIDQDGTAFHVVYGEYPFVGSVTYDANDIRTVYTMAPGSFALPLFASAEGATGLLPRLPPSKKPTAKSTVSAPAAAPTLPAALLFPALATNLPKITPGLLAAHSYTIEEDNLALKRPVQLFRLGSDDVQTIEKEWQKGSYRYLVEYRGREKVLGLRDIDDDGKYEVTEHYRDGKLTEVSYDGDQKPKPEFWISFAGAYPTLSWDYNQDGVPDAIERQLSPTRALVEISTKMNGVYDVRFEEKLK